MKILSVVAAFATVATFATAAYAAVTFDPATGTGFVGKGDVQLAFGWNNAVAQREANNVSFSYEVEEAYAVTVEFDTGNPAQPRSIKHHVLTKNSSSSVAASIAADARRTGQYTGWNLRGFGAVVSTGEAVPAVGDSCPNGDLDNCQVTAVEAVSSTGGLFVNWGGQSQLIQ